LTFTTAWNHNYKPRLFLLCLMFWPLLLTTLVAVYSNQVVVQACLCDPNTTFDLDIWHSHSSWPYLCLV